MRAKIVNLILTIIAIILFVVSIIYSKVKYFFPFFILFVFLYIIFTIIELKFINKKIKPLIDNEHYEDVLICLNKAINKCFSIFNVASCASGSVLTHMLIGDNEKAIETLNKHKTLKNNINLYYVQMLILISQNRLVEAQQYQKKLLKVKFKKYQVQKESSIKIFDMIENRRFDEDLYNNTKYPLLKEICLKYKNGDKEVETKPFKALLTSTQPKRSKGVKFFSRILNILSFLSMFASMIILGILINKHNIITSTDGMYYTLKYIWVFWLLLPVPIGAFIFGFIYKYRDHKTISNIVIGIIFTFLLLVLGSLHFISSKIYYTNRDYLITLEETLQINFPNNFIIITQDWTKGTQTSSDNNYYKYVSVVTFNDDEEAREFESKMDRLKWVNELSSDVKEFLPQIFLVETTNYDSYLLYCFESNEFNPKSKVFTYNYVTIAYRKETKSLIIYEFAIK